MSKDNTEQEPDSEDWWHDQHPVVSTVLWLIGGITKSPSPALPADREGKIPRNNSRLSWKDEHDGEIAEYIGHNEETGVEKKEKKSVSIMPRQTSLTQVKGSLPVSDDEEDDDMYPRDRNYYGNGQTNGLLMRQEDLRDDNVDLNTISPQWGWYVSTTPPQELYGKERPKNSHTHE